MSHILTPADRFLLAKIQKFISNLPEGTTRAISLKRLPQAGIPLSSEVKRQMQRLAANSYLEHFTSPTTGPSGAYRLTTLSESELASS